MKTKTNYYHFAIFVLAFAALSGMGKKKPEEPTKPVDPSHPTTPISVDVLTAIATNSTCAKYSWKNQGRSPKGYVNGMALTYAKSLCRLKANDSTATLMAAKNSGNDSVDAISWYNSNFARIGLSNSAAGEKTLQNLYTLLMGLGMRESSGKYCTGRDTTAKNPSSASAEAGLFQTSYDSMGASVELTKLVTYYKANPSKCKLDVFKEGVSCSASNIANYGSGAGAEYQKMNKNCPGFATEYAAVMLRKARKHYGPINRKEAELNSSCNEMLGQVGAEVAKDPSICAVL